MKKIVTTFVLLLLLSSCSNLSKNFTKDGDFVLRGGTFQSSKWKDQLHFKRYSWYHEVTMLYDVILTRIDPRSPFYDWFSNSEKKSLATCSDAYVAFDYSLDSEKISQKMMQNDAKRSGYEKIALPSFKSHLKLHPDVEELSLQLYDVFGYCYKGEISNKNKIFVRFPGFNEVVIP